MKEKIHEIVSGVGDYADIITKNDAEHVATAVDSATNKIHALRYQIAREVWAEYDCHGDAYCACWFFDEWLDQQEELDT